MDKKLLVLQHTPWEGPGKFLLQAAKRNKVKLEVVKVWLDWLPPFNVYDGLIVLGGAPNIDQESLFPFLVEEKRYIRRAVAEDMPYLGFCLGHQLLADALGAKIGPNFRPSIGFVQGHLTHEGREHPAFAGLAKSFCLFKWHSQAVQEPLPKHLVLLATSEQCQVEAFSVSGRPHILGVQFDNHAGSPDDVMVWTENDRNWLATLRGITINPAEIIGEAAGRKKRLQREFDRFFDGFMKMLI